MAALTYVEAVNSPGTPGKTGDDRYGFDAQAGTAWVLDGATDVTALKPFPSAESGAAWVAEALSRRLMIAPPPADLDARSYWRDVMADTREAATAASTVPLEDLPPEALPIASGIWLRRRDDTVELAWMGDCVALDMDTGEIHGAADAIAAETEDSESLASLTEAERWEAARQSRIVTNTTGKPAFGLFPERAAALSTTTLTIAGGRSLVLMSDGFYRLIEPYALAADGPALAAMIRDIGLSGALNRLRTFEADTPPDSIARIKPSDDSCALWVMMP